MIANLVAAFLGVSCTVGGVTGSGLGLAVNYTDADGNVAGGRVNVVGTFNPGGSPIPLTFGVPSNEVALTGTTSGQVIVALCVVFGTTTSLTVTVTLFDAASNQSNTLSITIPRPAGVPELPRSGGAVPGAIEGLRR